MLINTITIKNFKKILKKHPYTSFILFLLFLIMILISFDSYFSRNKKGSSKNIITEDVQNKKTSYTTISSKEPLGSSIVKFKKFSKIVDVTKKVSVSQDYSDFLSAQSIVYTFKPSSTSQISKALRLVGVSEPSDFLIRGSTNLSKEEFIATYLDELNNSFNIDSLMFSIKYKETIYVKGSQDSLEFENSKKEDATHAKDFYYLMLNNNYVLLPQGGFAYINFYYPLKNNQQINVEMPKFLPISLSFSTTISLFPRTYTFTPIAALDSTFESLNINGNIDTNPIAYVDRYPQLFLIYILDLNSNYLIPYPAKYFEYRGSFNSLLNDKRVLFTLYK